MHAQLQRQRASNSRTFVPKTNAYLRANSSFYVTKEARNRQPHAARISELRSQNKGNRKVIRVRTRTVHAAYGLMLHCCTTILHELV